MEQEKKKRGAGGVQPMAERGRGRGQKPPKLMQFLLNISNSTKFR
jgi:hypothetical protein